MLKRGFLLIAAAVLLLCCAVSFAESEGWVCGVCGKQGNFGRFCGECGEHAPEGWAMQGTAPRPDAVNTGTALLTGDVRQEGNCVLFGHYEQDYSTSDGAEPVQWLVLSYDSDANTVLLLSRYVLDVRPYDEGTVGPDGKRVIRDVTWEESSIREWLNGSFLTEAFSEKEQDAIIPGDVTADKNPEFGAAAGNPAKDRVFLLSVGEYSRYSRKVKMNLNCEPTRYAAENGLKMHETDGTAFCDWWLRTPGCDNRHAATVMHTGSVVAYGDLVYLIKIGVRPAIRVDLNRLQ